MARRGGAGWRAKGREPGLSAEWVGSGRGKLTRPLFLLLLAPSARRPPRRPGARPLWAPVARPKRSWGRVKGTRGEISSLEARGGLRTRKKGKKRDEKGGNVPHKDDSALSLSRDTGRRRRPIGSGADRPGHLINAPVGPPLHPPYFKYLQVRHAANNTLDKGVDAGLYYVLVLCTIYAKSGCPGREPECPPRCREHGFCGRNCPPARPPALSGEAWPKKGQWPGRAGAAGVCYYVCIYSGLLNIFYI